MCLLYHIGLYIYYFPLHKWQIHALFLYVTKLFLKNVCDNEKLFLTAEVKGEKDV